MPSQSDWESINRDVAQAITYGGVDLGYTSDSMPGISLYFNIDEVEERVGEFGSTALFPRHAGLNASATLVIATETPGAILAAFGEYAEGTGVNLNIHTIKTGARKELHAFQFVGLNRTLIAGACKGRAATTAFRRTLSEQNALPIRLTFYPDADGTLARWVPSGGAGRGGEAAGISV